MTASLPGAHAEAVELHRAIIRRCLAGQRIIRNTQGRLVLRPHCYADRNCCTCYAEHEAELLAGPERREG